MHLLKRWCCFVFLSLGALSAIAEEVVWPAPQPLREIEFPAFSEKTLPNGLRVVVIEHHEQPAVSLRMLTRAGRLFDTAKKAGLSQAVTSLLTEGTMSRSAQDIARSIDLIGGRLGAGAGWDTAFTTATVTSDQLEVGLDLLADIVLRPSFPKEELERWRKQSLSGLKVQFSDPNFLAGAVFFRTVFGEHPYGLPAAGTPESVLGLTREDLVRFHTRHYLPNASILAVVGDVEPKATFARVKEAFGDWKRGEAKTLPQVKPPRYDKPRILVVDQPDAVQTQIRVGHLGLAYTDPDFFVAQVYNSVVGGGVSARLYEEIRRKRGLSYGAGSFFAEQLQPGVFQANTFTKTESTVEALELVLEVLRGMREAPVPKAELESRKTFLTGAFPMQIETPNGIASLVLEAVSYGYDKTFLDSYRDRLDAIDAASVQRFAKERIHLERPVIVLAGNAEGFKEELAQKLGRFEILPSDDLDLLRADLRRAASSKEGADESSVEGATSKE